MTNEELTATCAEITRSKGFNTSNYPAQLLLMVTELGEALENFWTIDDPTLQHLVAVVTQVSATIEAERHQRCWAAGYTLKTDHNLLEELADLEIRLRSFIGANGLTDAYQAALERKIETNRARPHLHGKRN
jgi:hypothetical protein